MGRYDYYKSGDWNAECDVCGQKYKASKLKLRWDGLRVCPKDFEYRNPQDFVRGIKDNQSTPFSRPEPPDVFVPFNYTQFPSEIETIYDFAHNDVTKIINPHILMNDGINSESINFFAVNSGPGYAPTVDDFSVSENVSIVSQKNVSESLVGTEIINKGFTKNISESLSPFDFIKFNDSSAKTDSIATTGDSEHASVIKVLSDSTTETEGISKSFTKRISETLTTSDFVFFRDSSAKADSVATTGDSEHATIIKVLSDSITPSESVTFFLNSLQVINGSPINNSIIG